MNIYVMFMLIGNPKTHSQRFRLAVGFFFFTDIPFPKTTVLVNSCLTLFKVFTYCGKHKMDLGAIPCRKTIELRPELSSRPNW